MRASDGLCRWGLFAFLLTVGSGLAGELVLSYDTAEIRGNGARIDRGEERNCIGYWSATTPVEWAIEVDQGAAATIEVDQACPAGNAGAQYQVRIGSEHLEGVVEATEGWGEFLRVSLGSIALTEPGSYRVQVLPVKLSASGNVMNLRSVRLSGDGFEARQPPREEPPPRIWELVWADEFDGDGLPSPEKWTYEVGADIRNNELQYYTRERPENVRVKDGHLVIEARKEPYEGSGYTAGSLESVPRWSYGKIEVRARMPIGRGMWPAIWMLPPTIHETGWPACGEIDIMENVGHDPRKIHFSVHTEAYNHTQGNQVTSIVEAESPWTQFHVYALEWSPDRMAFFMDGISTLTFLNEGTGRDAWPFDQPFFLKLNLAIGGMWGSVQGVDDAAFPQRFVVDYMRVYREMPDGE